MAIYKKFLILIVLLNACLEFSVEAQEQLEGNRFIPFTSQQIDVFRQSLLSPNNRLDDSQLRLFNTLSILPEKPNSGYWVNPYIKKKFEAISNLEVDLLFTPTINPQNNQGFYVRVRFDANGVIFARQPVDRNTPAKVFKGQYPMVGRQDLFLESQGNDGIVALVSRIKADNTRALALCPRDFIDSKSVLSNRRMADTGFKLTNLSFHASAAVNGRVTGAQQFVSGNALLEATDNISLPVGVSDKTEGINPYVENSFTTDTFAPKIINYVTSEKPVFAGVRSRVEFVDPQQSKLVGADESAMMVSTIFSSDAMRVSFWDAVFSMGEGQCYLVAARKRNWSYITPPVLAKEVEEETETIKEAGQ